MQKIFGSSKTNIYFCTRFWRKAAFRLFGIGCKAICFADFFNKFFPKILEIAIKVLLLQSVSQKSGVFGLPVLVRVAFLNEKRSLKDLHKTRCSTILIKN